MDDFYCPHCEALLDPGSIEFDDDPADAVARCPRCGTLTPEAELIRRPRFAGTLAKRAPRGCKVARTSAGMRYSARLFSAKMFFPLLIATVLWMLPISILSIGLTPALYSYFVGPLPDGSPIDGPAEQFNLLPWLLLALMLFGICLGLKITGMTLLKGLGRIDVVIGANEGWVATGIGPLKWRRRFRTADVRGVRFSQNSHGDDLIEIRADRLIRFGVLLENGPRHWLGVVMRKELAGRGRDRMS